MKSYICASTAYPTLLFPAVGGSTLYATDERSVIIIVQSLAMKRDASKELLNTHNIVID